MHLQDREPVNGHITSSKLRQVDSGSAPRLIPPDLSPVTKQSSLHAHPSHLHPGQSQIDATASSTTKTLGRQESNRSHSAPGQKLIGISTKSICTHQNPIARQGTVVINQQVREERRKSQGNPLLNPTLDDLKRQAEGSYYEQKDKDGKIRRRSMLRSVSKDDYLTGRGANPRTGMITPGGGSIDSNIDALEELPRRNITPSKWRQEGDQWVNVAIDAPAWTGTTVRGPQILGKTRRPRKQGDVRRAQTPGHLRGPHTTSDIQRLQTSINYSEQRSNVLAHKVAVYHRSSSNSSDTISTMASDQLPRPTQSASLLPRLARPHPSDRDEDHTRSQARCLKEGANIRRKPVAQTSHKTQPEPEICPLRDHQDRSTLFTPPSLHDGNRSLSIPILPNKHLSPDANPKSRIEPESMRGAHSMRNNASSNHGQGSFLEMKPQALSGPSQVQSGPPDLIVRDLDKELPCLQMSSGQYLQNQYNTRIMALVSQTREENTQRSDIRQPRIEVPTTHQNSSRNGPAIDAQNISRTAKQTTNPMYCTIPKTGDLLLFSPPRPGHTTVGGPRKMPQHSTSRTRRSGLEDVFKNPHSTTSTSTGMSTSADKDQAHHWEDSVGFQARAQLLQARPKPAMDYPETVSVNAPTEVVSIEEIRTPSTRLPSSEPFPSSGRPRMPSRAIGQYQMLQLGGSQTKRGETHTESNNRSNQTGTPFPPRHEHTILCTTAPKDTRAAQSSKKCKPRENPNNNAKNSGEVLKDGPTRTRSHPHDETMPKGLPNIDGTTDIVRPSKLTSDAPYVPKAICPMDHDTSITEAAQHRYLEVTTSTVSNSGSGSDTLVEETVDIRDHSICCTDCCKLGCHDGCLGHPNPYSNPLEFAIRRAEKRLERAMSLSTSPSVSETSSTSASSPPEKSKSRPVATFVKSLFRRKRLSSPSTTTVPDSSDERAHNTKISRRSSAESSLSQRTAEKSRSTGAAIAARRAMGIDSRIEAPIEQDQLTIPKKRSNGKAEATILRSSDATAFVQMPMSIPPVVELGGTSEENWNNSNLYAPGVSQAAVSSQLSQVRSTSIKSIDVPVPAIGAMGLVGLLEVIFIVPCEAIRMWLHKNPQVMDFGWSIVGCCWSMACVITVTAKLLFHVIYIYSKTGRYKARNSQGEKIEPWVLVVDILRSMLYLLVLLSTAMILGRTLGIMLLPFTVSLKIGRYLLMGARTAAAL